MDSVYLVSINAVLWPTPGDFPLIKLARDAIVD
jgi:hypothetical protein